ncbi:MAG: TRAP transporter small permease [Alteromonadaceae bacterium]|nr:TRAP transporter small permease [Alteromonadaceae bacterium]
MLIRTLKTYCLTVQWCVGFIGRSVAWLMPVLAFVVAFEVFCRYVLDAPTIWAYDVSLFLFGYVASLGGAYAQLHNRHINVDVLYNHVPPRVQNLFNLISYVLAVFFLAIVFKIAIGKFEEAIQFNYRRQSEWAPSMHHYWVMIAVASALLMFQFSSDFIQQAYHLFTGKKLIHDPEPIDDEEVAA